MKYIKKNHQSFILYLEMDGDEIIRIFRHFLSSDTFDSGSKGRESHGSPYIPVPENEEINKEEFETIWKRAKQFFRQEQEENKYVRIKT
jgi:hypothetical protein